MSTEERGGRVIIPSGTIGYRFEASLSNIDAGPDMAVPQSLEGAQGYMIRFDRPDGSSVDVTATLMDGRITYITSAGDLDIRGQWAYRPAVIYTNGNRVAARFARAFYVT